MNGYCEIKIKGRQVGVLFGVRLFEICKDEGLSEVIINKPNSSEAMINVIYAGIKNNCDFERLEMDLNRKDIYIWANENTGEFERVMTCFSKSKMLGKDLQEVKEDNQKTEPVKKKKRSIFGRVFAKIV